MGLEIGSSDYLEIKFAQSICISTQLNCNLYTIYNCKQFTNLTNARSEASCTKHGVKYV